jgi:hypothetical protein
MRNKDGGRHDGSETLNLANRETETAFAALVPTLGSVDPVAAGFAAGKRVGQAAARRQLFAWRAAAAVGVVGMGLSWILPLTTSSTSSPHDVPIAQQRPAPPIAATVTPGEMPVLSSQSILAMQHAVAAEGLAGLPAPQLLPPARNARGEADLF